MPKYNQLTEQSLIDLAPYVQKGAAYLDQYCRETGREDWRVEIRNRIKHASYPFNMTQCHACTLGFIFGDYVGGLKTIFGTQDEDEQDRLSVEHGFQSSEAIGKNHNTYVQDAQFKALEILWLRAIGLSEDQL